MTPVLLTNWKLQAAFKVLLARQRAFKKECVPFIELLVFVSHPGDISHISGNAEHSACIGTFRLPERHYDAASDQGFRPPHSASDGRII